MTRLQAMAEHLEGIAEAMMKVTKYANTVAILSVEAEAPDEGRMSGTVTLRKSWRWKGVDDYSFIDRSMYMTQPNNENT